MGSALLRAVPWLCGIGIAAGELLAACTGDDPSPVVESPTPDSGDIRRGDFGDACYPNGTCNADLECRNGVCTARGSDDGGPRNDAGDAGATPKCSPAPIGPGPACPRGRSPSASCGEGEECCSLFDSVRCESSCAPIVQANDTTYHCTSADHCGDAESCCLVGAVFSETGLDCEDTRITAISRTECAASCSGPRFCSSTADCSGAQQCKVASVNMGGTFVYLGVCL